MGRKKIRELGILLFQTYLAIGQQSGAETKRVPYNLGLTAQLLSSASTRWRRAILGFQGGLHGQKGSFRCSEMEEVKCDFCGKTLEKYPSQINEHNFCSLECFHKWNQGVNNPRTLKPDLSPSKDLTYILGVCLGDGSVFYVENNRSYLVELTVIEKDFALSFKRALKRIGLNPSISDAGKTVAGNDLYRVRAHSLVFYKWFNELSLDQIYEVVSQKRSLLMLSLEVCLSLKGQ